MKYEILNYSHLVSNLWLLVLFYIQSYYLKLKKEGCSDEYVCDIENKTAGHILCYYLSVSRISSLFFFI